MATGTLHQACIVGSVSKLAFSSSIHCGAVQTLPLFCSLMSKKSFNPLKVSSEGLSTDLDDDDSKFVPLNPDDPRYGPPALLLLGFKQEEADQIQRLLKDLDGEFLKVIYCTEDMISRSLWDAVNTEPQSLGKLKIAESLPRICFLSGLSGEEMMMFIDAFEESGMEQAIFAAHVPNSSNKPLQELIEEIVGDHEMVTKRREDSK